MVDLSIANWDSLQRVCFSISIIVHPPSFIQLFEDVPRHMPGSEHRDCHSFVLCGILLLSFFWLCYTYTLLYYSLLCHLYIYMGLLAVWKLDMPRENADWPMDFEHPRWPSRKRTLWNGRYQAPILGCRWSRTDDLFLRKGLDINQINGIWPISLILKNYGGKKTLKNTNETISVRVFSMFSGFLYVSSTWWNPMMSSYFFSEQLKHHPDGCGTSCGGKKMHWRLVNDGLLVSGCRCSGLLFFYLGKFNCVLFNERTSRALLVPFSQQLYTFEFDGSLFFDKGHGVPQPHRWSHPLVPHHWNDLSSAGRAVHG